MGGHHTERRRNFRSLATCVKVGSGRRNICPATCSSGAASLVKTWTRPSTLFMSLTSGCNSGLAGLGAPRYGVRWRFRISKVASRKASACALFRRIWPRTPRRVTKFALEALNLTRSFPRLASCIKQIDLASFLKNSLSCIRRASAKQKTILRTFFLPPMSFTPRWAQRLRTASNTNWNWRLDGARTFCSWRAKPAVLINPCTCQMKLRFCN